MEKFVREKPNKTTDRLEPISDGRVCGKLGKLREYEGGRELKEVSDSYRNFGRPGKKYHSSEFISIFLIYLLYILFL